MSDDESHIDCCMWLHQQDCEGDDCACSHSACPCCHEDCESRASDDGPDAQSADGHSG